MTSQTVKKESVWSYPRPPLIESTSRHLKVVLAGEVIAETRRGYRILETGHPPTYYFPPEDVRWEFLEPSTLRTFCEFKGQASYLSINIKGRISDNAAWQYANPSPPYEAIRDYVSFYASRVDACFVDGEEVQPQSGDFYGGWITRGIEGLAKEEAETRR